MKTYLFSFLLLFFFINVSAQTPAAAIPAFQFYKADGKAFTRAQITPGHKSLFVFFDATCSHCQKAMLQLSKKYDEIKKINIYLVSLDQHITMNDFMSKYGKNLIGKKNVLLLEDRDHVFIPLFQPTKYPSLFLYSPKNTIVFNTSGDTELPKLFEAIKK
ncbi:peroxiredoxin [Pedobacter cryoconitis]|uniref:Peroxiredoxin n=1 Tax=Pedobacter cryoconitis TaxID=188932 RepID=A0A7W8ZHK3_9SPHI|nr:redoxin domain-containing protein [Pedobacter cryoconitis]MBB5634189.1 peroxiredoxin [Pedobacter cryoconitis]